MAASGPSGELRYGYQVVARLGRWSLDATAIEAQVIEANTFWLDGDGPFTLVVPVGRREWRWSGVQVLDQGPPMRIRVHGAPELR